MKILIKRRVNSTHVGLLIRLFRASVCSDKIVGSSVVGSSAYQIIQFLLYHIFFPLTLVDITTTYFLR